MTPYERRHFAAAFVGGVAGTLLGVVTLGYVVWHFAGSSKLGGEHVGRDATLTVLGGYGEASGGTLQANLIDIMASDDHVAGVANDTATKAGKTLDVRSTVIFAMRDGKVSEAWQYVDDVDALDAFLA